MASQQAVRALWLLGAAVLALLVLAPGAFRRVAVPAAKVYHPPPPCPLAVCPQCPTVASAPEVEDPKVELLAKPRLIDVTMGSRAFVLAVSSAEPSYLQQKALEFCIEIKHLLDVQPHELASLCQTPLASALSEMLADDSNLPLFFDDRVPHAIQREEVPFPSADATIVRQGDTVFLHIVANEAVDRIISFGVAENAHSVADAFCRENAPSLGLKNKQQLADCTVPVAAFVEHELNSIGLGSMDPAVIHRELVTDAVAEQVAA